MQLDKSLNERLDLLEIEVRQLSILINRLLIDDTVQNLDVFGREFEFKKDDEDLIGFKQN